MCSIFSVFAQLADVLFHLSYSLDDRPPKKRTGHYFGSTDAG